VTQLEYEAVLGRNPAYFTRANGGGPRHPVEQLTWAEAEEFCRALSRLPSERSAGRRYELPTEAEWEYAGRAGTTTAFSSGDSLRPDQANFDTSRPLGPVPARPALGKTSPVGQYAANPWGLHDLHGNVWEWCRDWYAADAYAVAGDTDPTGPPKGRLKVLRGGSWNNSGHLCRSARRNKHAPDFRSDTIGVRVKMVMG
jgi:formylglycine-generating enzyme required for sulfatase activity